MVVSVAPDSASFVVLNESGLLMRANTFRRAMVRMHQSDPPISEAMRVNRMLEIADAIIDAVKRSKARYIGFVDYTSGRIGHAHQSAELAGAIKCNIAIALRKVPEVVSLGAATKHVVGPGYVSADAMRSVVVDGLGWHEIENDQLGVAVAARYFFDLKVAEEKERELT